MIPVFLFENVVYRRSLLSINSILILTRPLVFFPLGGEVFFLSPEALPLLPPVLPSLLEEDDDERSSAFLLLLSWLVCELDVEGEKPFMGWWCEVDVWYEFCCWFTCGCWYRSDWFVTWLWCEWWWWLSCCCWCPLWWLLLFPCKRWWCVWLWWWWWLWLALWSMAFMLSVTPSELLSLESESDNKPSMFTPSVPSKTKDGGDDEADITKSAPPVNELCIVNQRKESQEKKELSGRIKEKQLRNRIRGSKSFIHSSHSSSLFTIFSRVHWTGYQVINCSQDATDNKWRENIVGTRREDGRRIKIPHEESGESLKGAGGSRGGKNRQLTWVEKNNKKRMRNETVPGLLLL